MGYQGRSPWLVRQRYQAADRAGNKMILDEFTQVTDTDNDPAFMNDTLCNYCREQGIVFTRSRAYH